MIDRTIEIEELIAAYAIDALDVDERIEAERLLFLDPSLWNLVTEHHGVMAVIAEHVELAPSTPSPLVWENIVHAIDGGAEATPIFRPAASERRTRWFSKAAIALSATALAVSAFVGVQLFAGDADAGLQAAVDDLLRDPTARIVTMAAPDGAAVEARVVIGDDGIGYVYADTLPALTGDRTYQLWAIVDGAAGQQVISAGVIGRDPGISPFQVTGELTGLAITNEIAGGVVTSAEAPTTVWLDSA